MSNSMNYMKTAASLFVGELANNNEALKAAREAKGGTMWDIGCNLIAHAAVVVFDKDYTRVKARNFRDDVVANFNITEKQASKWTESISAGLGVRGLRKGVQPIGGLSVAALDGPKAISKFLNDRQIETWNQFMLATRTEKSAVDELAKKLHKLSEVQRKRVQDKVEALDKADEAELDDGE